MSTLTQNKRQLLTSGYIRELGIKFKLYAIFPSSIIDVVYLFHKYCDLWNNQCKSTRIEIIKETNAIKALHYEVCNAFGEFIVEHGSTFKWRVKISSKISNLYIGIIKFKFNDDMLTQHLYDNDCYSQYDEDISNKTKSYHGYFYAMGERVIAYNGKTEKYAKNYERNGEFDILEMTLDLKTNISSNLGTISYNINGHGVDYGNAYDKIGNNESDKHCLYVCIYSSRDQTVQLL